MTIQLPELVENKIKFYLKEVFYCLHIKYFTTHCDCIDEVKAIDNKFIFSVSLPRGGGIQKMVGLYIRKNLKTIMDIFRDSLLWECLTYINECYAIRGQENEEGGEVFDLPDRLFQIYRQRRENQIDLYSEYHSNFDFEDDMRSLSDQDIFNLVVQNRECLIDDTISGFEMTYKSTFKQIKSVLSEKVIHLVDKPKIKLNLTKKNNL